MKSPLKQSIGIFGGTFDPVHCGHLQIAQAALDQLKLQAIRFIPCHHPPHRQPPVASVEQRLAMLKLALQDHKSFNLDDREIKRAGKSFMIDTLKSYRKDFPDTPLCLIIGEDEFLQFHEWHQFQEILNFTHLIIITRSHTRSLPVEIKTLCSQHQTPSIQTLHQTLAGKIYRLSVLPIEISATQLRAKLKKAQIPTRQLPPTVLTYITQQHLYQ